MCTIDSLNTSAWASFRTYFIKTFCIVFNHTIRGRICSPWPYKLQYFVKEVRACEPHLLGSCLLWVRYLQTLWQGQKNWSKQLLPPWSFSNFLPGVKAHGVPVSAAGLGSLRLCLGPRGVDTIWVSALPHSVKCWHSLLCPFPFVGQLSLLP